MKEVYDFLKNCGVFYIATMDNDQPRVRPFGALNIFEDKIYIETSKSKNVSKQIQINPKIEICAYKENSWVRIEAKAIRDDRKEAIISMFDANPILRNNYSVDNEKTEVLYLENAKATFYAFNEEPRTIEF